MGMTGFERRAARAVALAMGLAVAGAAHADVLTVDQAVKISLAHNSQVVNAHSNLVNAKSGVYTAYSGVLPHVSASYSRTGSFTDGSRGTRNLSGILISTKGTEDIATYSSGPALTGNWSILDPANLANLRAARLEQRSAEQSLASTREDVVLGTKRQYYQTVAAIHLLNVSAEAVRFARDDERRVHALFDVGSVAKSDLLKAQVATAQAELDSSTAAQGVVVQRALLAGQIGVDERRLGEVDTVLTAEPHDYDEPALLAEAGRNRKDIQAADSDLRSARAQLASARLAWVPYVTVSGSYQLRPVQIQESVTHQPLKPDSTGGGRSDADRSFSGTVALNWDLFTGGVTEGRVASAHARVERSQETRDALTRNLAGDIHQALLGYRVALSQLEVARRAEDSAGENLKLTQQKYNVGSATILDLIDAQVQRQRAQSNRVAALATIREAEAQLDRVRGISAE
jgi:outer membrane protein TolC